MTENNIDLRELGAKSTERQGAGRTVVHLALAGKLVGLIAIADAARPTAVEAIQTLRARGVEVAMLTGDNQGTAERIAKSLGIDRVFANVLPSDVVGAIELSHATLRKMHQNLWWAVGYNVIAFPLAAGVLYPILSYPILSCLGQASLRLRCRGVRRWSPAMP